MELEYHCFATPFELTEILAPSIQSCCHHRKRTTRYQVALDEITNQHLESCQKLNLRVTKPLDPTAHLQEIEKTEEHGEPSYDGQLAKNPWQEVYRSNSQRSCKQKTGMEEGTCRI